MGCDAMLDLYDDSIIDSSALRETGASDSAEHSTAPPSIEPDSIRSALLRTLWTAAHRLQHREAVRVDVERIRRQQRVLVRLAEALRHFPSLARSQPAMVVQLPPPEGAGAKGCNADPD